MLLPQQRIALIEDTQHVAAISNGFIFSQEEESALFLLVNSLVQMKIEVFVNLLHFYLNDQDSFGHSWSTQNPQSSPLSCLHSR